jgi:hypothetical protein
MKQCPWYAHVSEGGGDGPEKHCTPKAVKLTPRTPEASTVPEPIGKPGGPGLWHVKGMQLPPYIQHLAHHLIGKYGESRGIAMAKGIVAKWKAGIAPGGKKGGKPRHTHPDVRAAATKAIAQWDEKRGEAHRQSREHGSKKVAATVALAGDSGGPTKTKAEAHFRESDSRTRRCGTCSMFRGDHCTLVKGTIDAGDVCDYWEKASKVAATVALAPPAGPGLYQRPSQTTAASPPLPPDVQLPTAAEMRKLAGQVPDCTDKSLSASARNHLEAAAVKLSKDDVLEALHVLRAAQSDVYACHKADLGISMPAAYTASLYDQAAPSGANKALIASRDREMKWRALEQGVAIAIDKIRRKYYHGSYGGIAQQGRFSAGPGAESSLDKVVRLSR